jgi:hypothetical protein
MKIRSHRESHIVELDDGSLWKIFPGDLDITLHWEPDTELRVEAVDDDINSHVLVGTADNSRVRVIPADQDWSVNEVKNALRDE